MWPTVFMVDVARVLLSVRRVTGAFERLRQPVFLEVVHHRSDVAGRFSDEGTLLDSIVDVTMMPVGIHVVVVGRVVEPDNVVSRLPVVGISLLGEPPVEKPVVEVDAEVSRRVARGSLDDGIGDERRVRSAYDVTDGLVPL